MSYQQEKFKEIADKIREKTGKTEEILPKNFAGEIDKVYDAGIEDQKRNRWMKQIENLTNSYWNYGFAGRGWNEETFTPYTNLVIPSVIATSSLLMHTGFTDLKGIFEKFGTTIDLSKSSNITYLFSNSAVTKVPSLTFGNSVLNISYLFNKCTNLVSVDELVFSRPITNTTSAFLDCTSLEEIRISGEFKVSLDIHWSPLSKESVESIVSALSDSVSGQTVTFNQAKIDEINGESNWFDNLMQTKQNWIFALV